MDTTRPYDDSYREATAQLSATDWEVFMSFSPSTMTAQIAHYTWTIVSSEFLKTFRSGAD